jgi:hypothetical protein
MIINYDIQHLKDPIIEHASWIDMPNIRKELGIEQLQPLRQYWYSQQFSTDQFADSDWNFASPKSLVTRPEDHPQD